MARARRQSDYAWPRGSTFRFLIRGANFRTPMTSGNACYTTASATVRLFGFAEGGCHQLVGSVLAPRVRAGHPPPTRCLVDRGRRDLGGGGVLPWSAAAVRSHVGPGWGLVGVFTVFELVKLWCAILGLNQ
jgi:hypothetical protein